MEVQTNNWKIKVIRFLVAQTISLFGSSLVQYAIIWYITLSTSSGVMMSIATLCGYVPQIGISLFAGVWLDKYDRKKIMMMADGVIAFATLLIAIAFILGYNSIYLLFGVLIVRSIGTGIQTPAVNAILPQIVPSGHLMKINGINSSIQALIMFLSPAVSGAILSVTSIEITFFIDVITAIIGIGMMFTIPVKINQIQKEKVLSVTAEMKLGFRFLKEHRMILNQILFLMIVMVLISPSAFLTPLLVSRSFGSEVWRLSITQMTFSLGAVLGGVLIASWGGFKNRQYTILLATLGYGVMMIAMGAAPVFILFLLFNGLIGITMPCFNAPVTVYLQEQVEPQMHGRIFSVLQIANACSLPLGTLIFGPLADQVSIQLLLIVTGSLVVLASFVFYNITRTSASLKHV